MTEYHVLADGVSYRRDAGVTDEYGRPRTDHVLAARGDVIELEDDQAERLVRLGVIGDETDLEAMRYVERVKARRPAETAAMFAAVAEGSSVADATIDAFGLETVDELDDDDVDDELEAERERLDGLSDDELAAEAAALGHETAGADRDELLELVLAGPPNAEQQLEDGTGNDGTPPDPDADERARVEALTADDLRAEATELGHTGLSRLKHAELVELVLSGPPEQ